MQRLGLIAVGLVLIGATEPQPAISSAEASPLGFDNPAYQEPPGSKLNQLLGRETTPTPLECKDRIQAARDEAGLPTIKKETADPDKPILVWAVDHRREGCGVLVTMGDPKDIRPIPKAPETVEIMPAKD